MPHPEILVHISAPTSKQNDDLYHSLAEEYLQFEPHLPSADRKCDNQQEDAVSEGSVNIQLENTPVPTATGDANISKETYGSFPSGIGSCSQNQVYTQRSAVRDRDGSTSRLEQLERVQTRWRGQNGSRRGLNSFQQLSFESAVASTNWDDAIIDDTQLAFQALESQVLDDWSVTSADTSEDEAAPEVEPPQKAPAANAQPEVSRATSKNTTPSKTPTSLVTIAALPKSTQSSPPASALASPFPTPTYMLELATATEDAMVAPNFQDLPFEVLSPAPKVTVETPGTLPSQKTDTLRLIRRQNLRRVREFKMSRDLEKDERGHWAVDSSAWPANIQLEFWTSLSDYIQSGRLGWGVTLYRETNRPGRLGIVRVYCWGEIVDHVWSLLWLCSQGKIAGSGSNWLDAEDVAVIEVP
jgi:hypothetical protein